LNSTKLYVVIELIPQPQPQLPSPQPLLYNNLEIQNAFDIYTSYSQLLSQNDSFLCPTNLISPTKLSFITIFYNITPSQQPQTQISNPNEYSITNEDPIIRFHEENMIDFSEHEDQELFHHNNDQSDDEGVVIPTSPPLQYHQPKCPVELNIDHLPRYIDHHHFVQQQDRVQPPTSALRVGMTFNEKA